MKNQQYDFIKIKSKEIKEEIKSRKRWIKALQDEYCKVRTTDIQRKEIIRMIKVGRIMIAHYEKILEDREERE